MLSTNWNVKTVIPHVGQTKRKLNTRIKEHKNDINKKTGNYSVTQNIGYKKIMISIGTIPRYLTEKKFTTED